MIPAGGSAGAPARRGEGLDRPQRALVRLSAALAGEETEGWRAALLEARDRAPIASIEEAILQAHLFLGFPVTLNALILWREIEPEAPTEPAAGDADVWRASGEALCRRVYGPAYERLRENVRGLHPDLDRWMVESGYGRTLSRPGLDPVTRELCIVAVLSAGTHLRQLESHLWGALNVGARPEAVDETVEIAGSAEARACWSGVRHRAMSRGA